MLDPPQVWGTRAPYDAGDLVALLEEELGEVGTILSGDAGDQRASGHIGVGAILS
jgi:hypothetical protein